jgi:hypothetical protein
MVGICPLSRSRFGIGIAAIGLLAGCRLESARNEAPAPLPARREAVEPGRYIAAPGQGAISIAELRAAPPPQLAEVSHGAVIDADEHRLAAKGFVRIGTGCYPSDDEAARDWAMRTGARVGADKILLYTQPAQTKSAEAFAMQMRKACAHDLDDTATAAFVALYYVRYKLPFGAQFRSLTAAEMKTLGVAGGVQIGAIIGATPAAEANLRSGDFVLKFNGKPVADRAAFQDLLRANMGKRVTLSVSRDGAQFDRLVRLGVLATESDKVEK